MKGKYVSGIEIETPENPNYNYTIELKCRYYNESMPEIDKHAIYTFMSILRGYIGFKTQLGYFIQLPNKDGTIVIPIDVLSNKDVASYKDIMRNKIIELKHYLESEIDYDSFMNENKVAFSILSLYKFDYSRMLYISSRHLKNVVDITLKPPTFEKSKIRTLKFENDEVLEIYNPYLTEALICADFTVPYNEMSYMYNALHVYEHIMCSPWVDIKTKQGKDGLLSLNGLTSGLGNCFVYSIVNTDKAFTTYFNELVKWMYSSRDEGFWDTQKDHINLEISRTISETKTMPYHLTFARSPGCAYNMNYNKSIFDYWSNKPFNITVIHPFKVKIEDLEIKTLSIEHPIRKIPEPEKPKLRWFPYSIANMSSNYNIVTKKYKSDEIGKIIENYLMKNETVDGTLALDVIKRDASPEGFLKGKVFEYMNIFLISTIRKYIPKQLHAKAIVSLLSELPHLEYVFEYGGKADFDVEEERMKEHRLK